MIIVSRSGRFGGGGGKVVVVSGSGSSGDGSYS